MEIPEITKDHEQFDFSQYDSVKGYSTFYLKDGSYVVNEKQPDGYITRIYPKQSFFVVIKRFNDQGSLIRKGLIFNSGDFKKGIWYYYEGGALVRQEDNDRRYTFTFEELVDLLASKKIILRTGYLSSDFHTRIKKKEEDGPKWVVQWIKDHSKNPAIIEVLIIDGKNGKEVGKEYMTLQTN